MDLLPNPVLEVINLSNQHTNALSSVQKRHALSGKREINWYDVQAKRCKSCIIPALSNTTSFCELVKCYFKVRISCSMLPPCMKLESLFNLNCDPPIRLPIGRRIKEIIMDSIKVPSAQIHGEFNRMYTLCLAANSLEKVSVARNKDYVYFRHVSQHLPWIIRVIDIDLLSHLDVSDNDINMSLPLNLATRNLTHAILKGNVISFKGSSDKCLCCMYPKLSYLDISHSKLAKIPVVFFEKCDTLSLQLKLQNNFIDETTLSSDLKNILKSSHVNLSFNKIHYFAKETRDILLGADYGLVQLLVIPSHVTVQRTPLRLSG